MDRSQHLPKIVTLIALVSIGAVFSPILWSRPVRDEYVQFVKRSVAKVLRPTYVLVGDSLTADGSWSQLLDQHVFGTANLARPGASIGEVAAQVRRAHHYRAKFLLMTAGTNDVITVPKSLPQIICSYEILLDGVSPSQQLIVTLLPYTRFSEHTQRITEVNKALTDLLKGRTAQIIDLNPVISRDGVVLQQFTTDGVHLTEMAYRAWANEILSVVAKSTGRSAAVAMHNLMGFLRVGKHPDPSMRSVSASVRTGNGDACLPTGKHPDNALYVSAQAADLDPH